jgi:Cu-Zn family superoxide dismutase
MARRQLTLILALAGAALAVGAPVLALASSGASHASAELRDASGAVVGWADFTEDATGRLHVNVHVKDVSAGLHGIHIHAVGACGPTFAAAGGHYNPLGRQHGLANTAGAHAGDLPNLEVNGAGVGHLDATTQRVTLSAGSATLFDADGSAFIIHANEDDQRTDATNGNSGARIACAVVTAVRPLAG